MAAVLLKFGADPLLKCNPKNDTKIANGSELALPHPRTDPNILTLTLNILALRLALRPTPIPARALTLTLPLGGEHGQRPGGEVSRGVGDHR